MKYIPLFSNMQSVYKGYRYELIIKTVGTMGAIPETLDDNLRKLSLEQDQKEQEQEKNDYKRQYLLGR